MRVLFIGDVVGKPGRKTLKKIVPKLMESNKIDITVANGENLAGGAGITRKTIEDVMGTGIDVFTSGNHIWDKKEIYEYIEQLNFLLRPANYPPGTPGKGIGVYITRKNELLALLNISGRTFMPALDCPFRTAEENVMQLRKKTPAILVDFHAEATSEKQAMGWFLDGKVSAVVGTHTHVQTADNRILTNGTGYITDVGMTGPMNSIIGVSREAAIHKFISGMPVRFEVEKGEESIFNAVIIDIDSQTGICKNIERVFEQVKVND